jgi:ABC-type uncharacterized transport system substrate-binding protein
MRYILILSFLYTLLFSHPHVFIDVKFDIAINQNSSDIDVFWYFDEMTSNLLLMDFDQNRNNKLEKEEIAFLKQESFDNLKEFNYYISPHQKNKKLKFSEPQNFTAYIEGAKLVYKFSISTNIDLSIKELKIGCFDEENLTSFHLSEDIKIKINHENIDLSSVDSKLEDKDYYIADMLIVKWRGIK